MSTAAVEFKPHGATALIRLNRPKAGNTINESAITALEAIIERLDSSSEIRVVILTGTGRNTFCAGGDFRYFLSLTTREAGLRMSERMQAVLDRLWRGPQVVIAAINGKALGGGCEILTACHFRIASNEATFAFVQAANGITTGWGGGVRLFNTIGRAEALRLLLTAETIDATEALRIKLVNSVVKAEEVIPTALKLARKIARNSGKSLGAFLQLSRLIYEGNYAEAARYETQIFADLWVSDEFRRVMSEFHTSRAWREPEK